MRVLGWTKLFPSALRAWNVKMRLQKKTAVKEQKGGGEREDAAGASQSGDVGFGPENCVSLSLRSVVTLHPWEKPQAPGPGSLQEGC